MSPQTKSHVPLSSLFTMCAVELILRRPAPNKSLPVQHLPFAERSNSIPVEGKPVPQNLCGFPVGGNAPLELAVVNTSLWLLSAWEKTNHGPAGAETARMIEDSLEQFAGESNLVLIARRRLDSVVLE